MDVLIIEDEQVASRRLEQLLIQIDPSISVLAKYATIRDSVEWLGEHSPDLIFSDIQLSDGLSFRIFEQVEVNTPVIFTTAYDQYAIKAFEVNSIDYLLKPIEKEKLAQALEKYHSLNPPGDKSSIDLDSLHKAFIEIDQLYKKRFMIMIGPKVKVIEVEDIAYFHVQDKNVFIKTKANQSLAIDHSLDKLEEMLDPSLFFRINRKYIVHLHSIESMYTLSKSRMKLTLTPTADEDIYLSFNRSRSFKNWLNH